jgi:hypothetical protein
LLPKLYSRILGQALPEAPDFCHRVWFDVRSQHDPVQGGRTANPRWKGDGNGWQGRQLAQTADE